jgi:hypothetical protein
VLALTERSFGENPQRSQGQLDRLHRSIQALNNDEILLTLKASGLGGAFGDLRNFLTEIKFIAQRPMQPGFQLDARMRADMEMARRVVDTACETNTEGGSATARGGAPAGVGTPGSDPEVALGTQLHEPRRYRLSLEQQAFLRQNFKLDLLLKLLFGSLLAVALVLAAHYGIVFLRVWRRNRRCCQIPAEMHYLMTPLRGHVSVLGRFGCVFELDPEAPEVPQDVTPGIFCTLELGERPLNGKLTDTAGRTWGMRFRTPLSPAEMRGLLALSELPPRLDFSVIAGGTGRRSGFGAGGLISLTQRR